MEEKEPKKIQVYNLIVLDESGSMYPLRQAATEGLTQTLSTIKQAQAEHSSTQDHYVTLVTFSDFLGKPSVRTLCDAVPVAQIPDPIPYSPNGNTPLLDAMGISLEHLESQLLHADMATALVTIITDGAENSSRIYDFARIRALVERLTEVGWTFSYMGSSHNVKAAAARMGINNVLEFAHEQEAMENSWMHEQSSKQAYYARLDAEHEEMSREDAAQRSRRLRGYVEQLYGRRVAPEHIDVLAPGQVFVFGSNAQGRHLGGAARQAVQRFGAVMGQGEGLQGQSYAIPTMGTYEEMELAVQRFLTFAAQHSDLTFLVTRIGCGIAGYGDSQVAPLFKRAVQLHNVALPESFWKELGINHINF